MAYIGNQPTTVAFLTDQFSGTGSQTAFTLSAAPANTNSILVSVSGVLQDPTTYSVSGTTLTFSAAPPSGTGNISVRFLGIPASGVTTTAYRTQTDFTATAGQTTFTPPSYTVGYIDVYRNGAKLGAADFTATNGTTVVLASGASSGDLIQTVSFYVSSVLNAIPATNGAVTSAYLLDGSVTSAKFANLTTLPTSGGNITLPSVTGTAMVSGNMPAFNAYRIGGNQSISNNTVTVVACNAENFDTNSNYNTSDYRFTPTVEGYYQVNFVVGCNGTTVTYCDSRILKNGGTFKIYGLINGSLSGGAFLTGSDVIYMNGSTDYLQIAGYITASSGTAFASDSGWSACLVRRA